MQTVSTPCVDFSIAATAINLESHRSKSRRVWPCSASPWSRILDPSSPSRSHIILTKSKDENQKDETQKQSCTYSCKRPVRPGDYLEIFAEIDLLIGLSSCPGGNCSSEHSSDVVKCYPLGIEIYKTYLKANDWQSPTVNQYDRTHGN